MYRKILVPVDGSDPSQRGLQEAVTLAARLGAAVHLLHVVDAYPMGFELAPAQAWDTVIESLRATAHATLGAARGVATAGGVTCTEHLVEFPPTRVADVITEEATAAGCDLIVMGTHGRRGFSHAMLGSDAERVLRQSPLPVLLVRQGPPAG